MEFDLFPETEPDVFFEATCHARPSKPTIYYSLKPIGIGTGECEALISYVWRLADTHHVSARTLLIDIFSRSNKKPTSWQTSRRNNYTSMGKKTEDILALLSHSTGVDSLVHSTMHPLRDILSPIGLFKNVAHHCPLCVMEDSSTKIMYNPLLWELEDATACPRHKVALLPSKCGADTTKHLNSYRRKVYPGVCATCGSIGFRCIPESSRQSSPVEVWKSSQVAELIAALPEASRRFSRQNTILGLTAIVDMIAEGKSAIAARHIGKPKSVFWGWVKGAHLPNLDSLLTICMKAEVSLVSMLEGDPKKCCPPKGSIKQLAKKRSKSNAMNLEEALTKALSNDSPKSISHISKLLGVDRKTIRINFPDLYAKLISRAKQYRESEIQIKHNKIENEIRKIAKDLKERKKPITHRNIQSEYGKAILPSSYSNKIVNAILNDGNKTIAP